ncbi:MAG: N-acetylmuramic acid 6-phosphate etherase [Pseudomonadota bacterium]
MVAKTTEHLHTEARALDARPPLEVASILADGQVAAATSVHNALSQICAAASAMAGAIRNGARLHYVAAGSSGLMAAADAQELGGTFSIPADQIRIHMAGGLPTGPDMPGETEDDISGLATGLAELTARDVIIAVSASGSTPYTVAAVEIAKTRGATVIAIANNPDTPLLAFADQPILLQTPPEVLSGSTRMGAGTSQKIALNMLSTLMAVDLGHVHDGMMVNLRADNAKLRARAAHMVSDIGQVSLSEAEGALVRTQDNVKAAILVARGLAADQARQLLDDTGGLLRPVLEKLEQTN